MDNNVEKVDLDRVDWKSSREFFESLGEALDKLDDKDESYNFTWVGKRKSIVEAGAPINKTLRPDMEASKNFDDTKNMLIVGDNLDALKLLQESYLGKIKMIYIDPPYNTGHDFVYHDNFTIKKADFEDSSKDTSGNIIVSEDEYLENSKANGRYHSDWLSMMYPRLKLARNLLADDGAIFISIDDNEVKNLREICDEIFGEENFSAQLVWKKVYGIKNDVKQFSVSHDYIVVYAKNAGSWSPSLLPRTDAANSRYKNPDNDQRGNWKAGDFTGVGETSTVYPIITPSGKTLYPPKGKHWIASKENYEKLLADNRIWFGIDGDKTPAIKRFLSEVKGGLAQSTILDYSEVGHSDEANRAMQELMGASIFNYPKPTRLLQRLVHLGTNNNEDIVLDFFAGSGTTGHAVMNLNANDGGERSFILVQLNEETAEKSEAKKAGYDTIDQITAERLRRAGDRISKEVATAAPFERAERETGVAATFVTDETKAYGESEAAKLDTGFRVFRIDSNNENEDIRKPLNKIGQSNLFEAIDNVKKDRTPLDLLFGVVYVSALPFDLKLETRKIGENTVYLYGYLDEGTGLVACFDDNIPEETIKEIANLKALTAAFKDSSFVDSAAKINLSEHFRIISPDTKVKVI